MTYFRELPNIFYQSTKTDRSSSNDYVQVKNIFRRAKLRDDLKYVFTSLVDYYIRDGFRPDTVAQEIYNDPELDWVVLTSANIINVRDEWPLNSFEVYNYSLEKYGKDLNQIRYYETTEVKDSSGRLILPKGKVVDDNFTIPDPSSPTATLNPVSGVTNYEYETILNDAKRSIYIIAPSYLQIFLNDMKDIMRYTDSSQFVNTNLIKTENTRNTDPN
jgi:hypothetical protein|tara:strand:+ start:471 stop:1121 length:651 start_codon:yes stop_codon:yes gene_type:complete